MALKVYHKLNQLPADISETAVAIGNFDGIHLGHRSVLRNVVETAKRRSLTPSVLTFFPHPLHFLKPEVKLEALTTFKEKLELLEQAGIEIVLATPFDKDLASLSPEDFFLRFLKNGLKASSVHIGTDFCFGKNRSGNTETLKGFASKEKIEVHLEPPFLLDGERVSSSNIRKAIQQGAADSARKFLGRPYSVGGPVVHGDGRGKTIGIPTANILFPAEKVLPKSGVYVTEVLWQKQVYKSVTNVGTRPTFESKSPHLTVETHILDFTHRIYDEYLELRFLKFIRDEKRFENLEALVAQIRLDVESARHYNALT